MAREKTKEKQPGYIAGSKEYVAAGKWAKNAFGVGSRQYNSIINGGVNCRKGTGSSPLLNCVFGETLPIGRRVMTLEDAEEVDWRDPSFFDESSFYFDLQDICVASSTPSYRPNTQILEALTSKFPHQVFPFLVSGLELVEDSNSQNPYGLLLVPGKNTAVKTDKRFHYSNNGKKVPFGRKEKTVFTKKNGVSQVCADRGGVDSGDGDLRSSDGRGRVVIVDAGGVARKLDIDSVERSFQEYFAGNPDGGEIVAPDSRAVDYFKWRAEKERGIDDFWADIEINLGWDREKFKDGQK